MRLEKYHGLGNSFLILLDVDDEQTITEEQARWLCDPRYGIGADGVIRAGRGRDGADVTMELRNADGSVAETSGNGLRCLVRAVVEVGAVAGPEVVVLTGAGRQKAVVNDDGMITVDMGQAKIEPFAGGPFGQASLVDMGNPHLVVLDDGGVNLPALGARYPELNVEVVRGRGREIEMSVWERGVGPTLACGTGAAAAAAAAHDWRYVGNQVTVHQPGGDLLVDLGSTILLTGPAQWIATVDTA